MTDLFYSELLGFIKECLQGSWKLAGMLAGVNIILKWFYSIMFRPFNNSTFK